MEEENDYPILEIGDVVLIVKGGYGFYEENEGLYCIIQDYSETGYYGMPGYIVSNYDSELVNHDWLDDWVGVETFGRNPMVLLNTLEGNTSVAIDGKDEVIDRGKHYRYSFRLNLTQEDIDSGYVMVNIDPYRISTVYNLGGWREHLVKKGIRGTEKGHTELELLEELQCILDRAKQMYEESRES